MNSSQSFLLVLQFLASISVLGFLAVHSVKRVEESQKFKLYAVRDKWLFLVMGGSISQNDFVFKTFYKAINRSISEMKFLTFGSLIEASLRAKSALETEKRERLHKAIDDANPEVRQVIAEFGLTMMSILVSGSVTLRLILHCYRIFKKIERFFGGKLSFQRSKVGETYSAYRYFEDMQQHAA